MIDLMMGTVQGEIGEIMDGVKMMTLVEKTEGRQRMNIIFLWVETDVGDM